MGLDLLDPIQPNTPGMDPQNLAANFGSRLSFYGGVDTQRLLPYGTAKQVEQKVLELIRVLGSTAAIWRRRPMPSSGCTGGEYPCPLRHGQAISLLGRRETA